MKKLKDADIIFRIDAFTPETLPLARLAEYLTALSALFGSEEHIHFLRVGAGSARLVQKADPHALPEVRHRLRLVDAKNGPQEAQAAYDKINGLMIDDNAVGDIRIGKAKVVSFPGRKTPAAEMIGPIRQQDFLDGVLIRIGGKDDTIPVHIREDEDSIKICTTNMEMARKLAPHLYGSPLRVFGAATWMRHAASGWELQRFFVENFMLLKETSLQEALDELGKIPIRLPANALEEVGALRKTNEKNGRN